MAQEIQKITRVRVQAIQSSPLSRFSVAERTSWSAKRETKREEDAASSLLGVSNIHMPLIYGEGWGNALFPLLKEIHKSLKDDLLALP
jgi:hypothetical protein